MKIKDIGSRALMTFFEGFFCVLIPELVVILTNVLDYDWTHWTTFVIPLVCGAIASGISAAWNSIRNVLASRKENS